MATSISWPPIAGAAFSIPAAGEVGWASLSNFLIALQNAQGTEAQKIGIRQATASPVTVAVNDCVVLVNVAGPATVQLPVGINGQYYVINDSSGSAATNNITILPNGSQTINGAASAVIDLNFNSYLLVFRAGTPGNWSILTSFNTIPSDIPRSSIAAGNPNYVVINDGAGLLSEEAALSSVRGGLGTNASAFNGYVKGNGLGTFTAGGIPTGDLPTGIPATNISSGLVDNTQFDRIRYQGRAFNTTKVTGGVVSVNANPALFDISSGTGFIVDYVTNPASPVTTEVSFGPFTAQTITNILTNDLTYILINSSGAIVQITSYPTPDQQRDNIFLARINHVDHASISFIDNIGNNSQSIGNQFCDLIDAIGPFNVGGNTPSPIAASLTFAKSSGSMFSRYFNQVSVPKNPHIIPIAAASPTTFRYATRTTTAGSDVTLVDPLNYDVAGTVTLVPGPTATATIQRIFLFPSGNVRVQYGQQTYANLAAALQGLNSDPFVINPTIQGFSILIGYILIQKNCLNLADAATCTVLTAGRFDTGSGSSSFGSTTLQQAYNNSTIPQIVLTAIAGELQVRDNSTPLGTDLFSVSNSTAATKYLRVDAQGVKGANFATASRAIITDANSALGLSVVTSTELALLTGTVGVTGTVALVRSTTPTLQTPIIGGSGVDPTYAAGKMWYDTVDQTMRYYNDSTADSVNIGQEVNVKVRNVSGSPMTAGQVVRITGAVAGIPAVALAQANTFANSKVFAVITETIANNTNGYATVAGRIKNLNLSAFSDGDLVFLSTSVAGGLTNVRPTAPNYAMPIGSVSSNHASQGILIVDFGVFRRIGLGTANQLRGVNAAATEEEYKTLSGTSNQITVTQGVNSITLALDPAALNSASGVNLIQYPSTYVAPPWAATGAVFTTTPPVTTSTAADLPLNGVVPTAIKITATGSAAETAQFVSYPVTTSAAMNGKLQIDLFLKPGTNFASNEWTLSVYQSATRQSLSSDQSGVTFLPNNTGRFTCSVDVTPGLAYTLRFARVSGGTTAVLNVCNVFFGVPFITQGAAVSDIFSMTFAAPSGLGTGSGTNTAFGYRDGSTLVLKLRFLKDGSGGSGAATVTWTMPSGFTINTAALPNNTLGPTWFAGTNFGPGSWCFAASSTTFIVRKEGGATNYTGADFPANNEMEFELHIPIAEWAGNGTVNLGPGAQNEFVFPTGTWDSSTTSFSYGQQGAQIAPLTATRTKDVTWQYPIQSGDQIIIEGSTDRSTWFPMINGRIGAGLIAVVTSIDSAGNLGSGILWHHISNTTTRITLATNANMANDDSPVVAWPSDAFLRIRKYSPSSPVGFGLAGTDGSSGLYKAGQAPGLTTGAAATALCIGEMFGATAITVAKAETLRSNTTTNWTTTASDVVNRTLNKGLYLVSAMGKFTGNAGGGNAQWTIRVDGTAVTSTVQTSYLASGEIAFHVPMLPIRIIGDGAVVALYGAAGGTTANTVNDLYVVRIA